MACCFGPRPRLCSRSLLILNTWAPISAFWQFYTPGAKLFSLIPTCIAWSREEDSHPITVAGFPADLNSFCRSRYSVWCSEESSLALWNEPLRNTSLLWLANLLLCDRPPRLQPYCAPPPNGTGSSTPSHLLPDQSKSSPISLVILTAWPSPTLAS